MPYRKQDVRGGESRAFTWVVLATLGAVLAAGGMSTALAAAGRSAQPFIGEPEAHTPSEDAREWARRVVGSDNHQGLPFAVVDKRAAQVVMHRADGTVAGSAPSLLGRQRGDHSVPGVGQRTQSGNLRIKDMTTPAGRFVAHFGRNHTGEAVLWLHEGDALALHRLRPGKLHAVRARALATQGAGGKRLSAGCVVVSAAFFDAIVTQLFEARGGIVYVLPELGTD